MPAHAPTVEGFPRTLFITCSDWRLQPDHIAGAEPGELFVARNVANLVPPFGSGQMSLGAVLEYALLHLHVTQVVVCGHTDCGGIKALDEPPDWRREAHLARWIEYARPAQTQVEASGLPAEERHLATVRGNVLLQLGNLRTYDAVREAEGTGALALQGWVYHLDTGRVEVYEPEADTWVDRDARG
jgi:carbonic anhydrase